MAEALVGVFAEVVLTKVISLASERISGVLGVKEDLQSLAKQLKMIQARISDAKSRSTTYKTVEVWLQELEDAAINADDLLDEFAYEVLRNMMLKGKKNKVRRFISSSNPVLFRLKMVSKIKKIKQQINTIYINATLIGLSPAEIVNSPTDTGEEPLTGSWVDDSKIVGRKDEVRAIVGQLTCSTDEKDLAVIGIVGMAGQGKTTLAQLLMKNDEVKRHFEKRVWICVSKDFNVDKVLEDMLKSLTGKLPVLPNKDEIVKQLSMEFLGKRFLLVFDGIWNVDFQHWDSMINSLQAIGSPKGSKIIVTTRNEVVVREINGIVNRLGVLSGEDSQELFEKIAFGNGRVAKNPHLLKMGERIVASCGGVPLALKAIGGLMSSQRDELEWLEIEKSIWSKLVGVRSTIKLSFNNLPSLCLKQCFAYCSIFPKGSVIKKKILIQEWMAHGLLNPTRESNLEMEDIGNNYFKILLGRSLLEVAEFDKYGYIVSCKMHDLMHEFALEVSKDHCLTAKVGELIDDIKAVMVVRDGGHNLNISEKIFSRLRTLHLPDDFSEKNFLVNCKCKRVRVFTLADEGVEELPISVAKMKHLRYLDISRTSITAFPEFITKLYNLQTLRLPFVKNLPKDFVRLVNLRYLYVNEEFEVIDLPRPPLVSEISEIENVPNEDDSWELALSLNNIEGSSNDESVLEGHQPPLCLKDLKIENFKGKSLPSWIQQLHNLMSVELVNLDHCEQIPPLGHLPYLKILHIVRMSNIAFVDNDFYGWRNLNLVSAESSQTSVVVFPSLKELTFTGMLSLEEWSDMVQPSSVSSSSIKLFPSLEKLEISFCPNLTHLPEGLLRSSTGLESLHIQSCHKLVSMPNLSSLNSLKYLHISSCRELLVLPREIEASRSIQTLDVTCLASVMESLFQYLTNLKELTLRLSPTESISSTTEDDIQISA